MIILMSTQSWQATFPHEPVSWEEMTTEWFVIRWLIVQTGTEGKKTGLKEFSIAYTELLATFQKTCNSCKDKFWTSYGNTSKLFNHLKTKALKTVCWQENCEGTPSECISHNYTASSYKAKGKTTLAMAVEKMQRKRHYWCSDYNSYKKWKMRLLRLIKNTV